MTIATTPALAALQAQIAAIPLAVKPLPDGPKSAENKAWRDAVKKDGGTVTTLVATPDAKAALADWKTRDWLGHQNQSRAISAAILYYSGTTPPSVHDPRLDAEARHAIAKMRADWQIDTDAEAISLAARWFVKFVEEEGIESLDLNPGSEG